MLLLWLHIQIGLLTYARRTGITVPDLGPRDENGLEPMDHLFSSPEKRVPVNTNGKAKNAADSTVSSEEDMDVVDSTIACRLRSSRVC